MEMVEYTVNLSVIVGFLAGILVTLLFKLMTDIEKKNQDRKKKTLLAMLCKVCRQKVKDKV